MKGRAIVTYEPSDGKPDFRMEDVDVLPTRPNELLVQIVASGICHTDLVFATFPAGVFGGFPRVLGHEGLSIQLKFSFPVNEPSNKVQKSPLKCRGTADVQDM
jgi:Zn-dependent alcohol dehydrogenase